MRRLSTVTASSEGDLEAAVIAGVDKPSTSSSGVHVGRAHAIKRKATSVSADNYASPSPPSKRKRSGTAASAAHESAANDPVRKYCLGKFEEMFKEIYLKYPYIRLKEEQESVFNEDETENKIIQKELAHLSDEEKEALLQDSKQFACELEICVFELHAEPDKYGSPHAGGKYK